MSKVLIELDLDTDKDVEFFKQYHSDLFGDKKVGGKSKTQPKEEPSQEEESEEITPQDVKDACEEYKKATSAKQLKELLSEFDVTTPAAAAKSDDFEEIYEALMDALEELDGEAEEEEAEEEVSVEDVKKACQAFAKNESKEELEEILEEFGIQSVRSLSKLSPEELAELYEEVSA